MSRGGAQRIAPLIRVLLLGAAAALWAGPEDRYPVPEPLVDPQAEVALLETALARFYPIGWSLDGKLAYLEQGNIGGGCGDCPYIVVTIQNLVTDEILWRWQSGVLDPSEEDLVVSAWREHAAEIQAELERQGIEPLERSARTTMGVGPRVRALGREYTFEVRSTTMSAQVPYPYSEGSATFQLVLEAELTVSAPGLGSKRIHRASFEPGDRVLEMEVAGALLSDTSPRAAVVVATISLDFEHNRIVEWWIVGAHLTYGYQ